MPTTILGKVAMIPRGVWTAGTYNKNEYVYYEPDNAQYVCIKDGTTSTPTDDGVNWFKSVRGIGTVSDNNYTDADKAKVNSAIQPEAFNPVKTDLLERGINVKNYGASGSNTTTTGTIAAGSTALTLASAIDFADGQGISINHAGQACTLTAPAAPTVTPTGAAGTTTYQYQIVALDGNGGCTTAGTAGTTATGNATLDATNYNVVSWAAVSGAAGYAVYGRTSGSMVLLGLATSTTFSDAGAAAITSNIFPASPPTSALADTLITSIVSGGGTTSLTLAASAISAVTNQSISHDDSISIQSAIDYAFSLGGGTVCIPSGNYKTTTTIIIKSGVGLIMSKGTVIFPCSNINVIQIKENSQLDGGSIDCTNITFFDKACIFLDGADKFSEVTDATNTIVKNIKLSNKNKYTGIGIHLYCSTGGQYIEFVHFENIDIFMFFKGIYLEADSHDESLGGSWINANEFDNINLIGCRDNFYLQGNNAMYTASGNRFTNFNVQPYFYFTNRAVYVEGDFNVFEGMVWDYPTENQTIAFEIASGNGNIFNTNITKMNQNIIIDKGYNTRIISAGDMMLPVLNVNNPSGLSFNGDQDDFLAYANLRYSITSTPLPDSGSIPNLFNPTGAYVAIWNNLTSNSSIVVEIDMSSSPLVSLQTIGISFLYKQIAQGIKIEYATLTNSLYQTLVNTNNNYQNNYYYMYEGVKVNFTKLKFTFTLPLSNIMQIGRIFAQDTSNTGRTWLSTGGGNVYGDIALPSTNNGVILTDRTTSAKYRLKVTNGVLGVEAV